MELERQNRLNEPNRRINVDREVDAKIKQSKMATELGKQFGALAVVLLSRATKFGSEFDHKLFEELQVHRLRIPQFSYCLKSKVKSMTLKLLMVIQTCFATLDSKEEVPGSPKISVKQASEFLQIIYKILPDDLTKICSKIIEQTIPNLTKLSRELEDI